MLVLRLKTHLLPSASICGYSCHVQGVCVDCTDIFDMTQKWLVGFSYWVILPHAMLSVNWWMGCCCCVGGVGGAGVVFGRVSSGLFGFYDCMCSVVWDWEVGVGREICIVVSLGWMNCHRVG